ncbi:MAG: hydroxymethylglutaryl-CoA reductase, degradative [Chloroflexi bacterium]|nr:hydroxymethylglutaryl-CoA reductase, degradative [Chloroflexota bacterium]
MRGEIALDNQRSSRLPGFYQKSLPERIGLVAEWAGLNSEEQTILATSAGLMPQQANQMVENALGVYGLPLGVATNFQINGKDYLVPMVIEEPSVVAACSFAAKMARSGGGFITSSDEPIMIGQIQVLEVENLRVAADRILAEKETLLALVNDPDLTIVKLGGGGRDIDVRQFEQTTVGPMLVVDLFYDTRDAMGANAINTACEKLAPALERITGGRVNLRILSNLSDRRKATASCIMTPEGLTTEHMPGALVVKSIVEAAVFAEVDPYRATTHNKGVMNGIDAVVMATGNDWRAVEAGAHAYAARDGRYTSMTRWWADENGNLRGMLTLPMAVGTVGGATKVHPTAQIAMKILGVASARELAEVIVSVGLAQNFAAIRALATEGIQAGHMALHARQLALAAGAQGEMVNAIVETMIAEGNIRLDRAKALVRAILDKPLSLA